MQLLDWILTALPLLIVVAVGLTARRYMRSVAHFISGGRLAGRYLLAVAGGELQAGAAVFVAYFEQLSQAGFTVGFWGALGGPIYMIIAICGFVTYRRRETRAMTLAQFFEMRYNKSFRVCTGVLGFLAGILNFGIIPSVGARFLVYFWQWPQDVHLFSLVVPTYIPLMGLFLGVTLFITLSGGVITLLVVNCIEGILSQLFYLVIILALLFMFRWQQIDTVLSNRPAGQSMLNPFDSFAIKDFNLWFVLMGIFLNVYGTGAWQNAGAYAGAARTPHESVMGSILGRWRELGKGAVITVMGVCAMTFMSHPDFASQTGAVKAAIANISNPTVQEQMSVPIALAHLLPVGVKGIFCAILLMGVFGGDATHLHSWGSIFVQDILVPLRRKPFEPHQHIRLLRLAITGVAIFAFIFGSLFRTTEHILMWWSITTAVYVGGAGAAIIGGLYWKKGTSAGAYAALLVGSTLSAGGILLKQLPGFGLGSAAHRWSTGFAQPFIDACLAVCHRIIDLNGTQISFFAALLAIATYVIVSLLTSREDFNMDRMLHRGEYALPTTQDEAKPISAPSGLSLGKIIGLDEKFTTSDKWISGALFWWGIFWFVAFLVVAGWNVISPWPPSAWSTYWHIVGFGIPIFLCLLTGIWFTWGGITDIRAFFSQLRDEKVDNLDDGTVINHQNLDENPERAK